jgi:anhydro-N-acetylmuramic acid kinase
MTLAIGIMSGTSVDGIDAVLLKISDNGVPLLRASASHPIPQGLRDRILSLMSPGNNEIDICGRVHVALGELYADIANELASGTAPDSITVIGSHGQTVRHRPDGENPFTLQLGSGAVIAARTGIATVADFRSTDMALGGQGAPFAPFFHHHVFTAESHDRAIVNLGGIANVTILPGNAHEPVAGFDSGPANGLMDLWIQRHLDRPYDKNGEWGRQGRVDEDLLAYLLAEPYFQTPPPKSTGRELFNASWLDQMLAGFARTLDPVDVQATLAALTARSISNQIPGNVSEIYLCGGGAQNDLLRDCIAGASGLPVADTEQIGIPSRWVEAAAFAWMAVATLDQRPVTLPSVTGASRTCVAGAVYYP